MQFLAIKGILCYGGGFSATLTNQLYKVSEFPPLATWFTNRIATNLQISHV